MARWLLSLLLVTGLTAMVKAQEVRVNGDGGAGTDGQLTCKFTSEFAMYTTEEQNIKVVYRLNAPPQRSGEAKLAITSVLDISGSMAGNRISMLKEVQKWVVDRLAQSNGLHSLGAVTFANRANLLFDLTEVAFDNEDALFELIDKNTIAAGNTNLMGGLFLGIEQQMNNTAENVIPVIFLLTDGVPNRGRFQRSPRRAAAAVRAEQQNLETPLTIHTIGLGTRLDLDLLQNLADAGNGQRFLVITRDQIATIFGGLMGGLESLTAIELDVDFQALGGAEIVDIQTGWIASEPEEEGGPWNLNFHNLYLEEQRDALITLRIPAGTEELVVLSANTTYRDAVTFEAISKETLTLKVARGDPTTDLPEPIVEEATEQFEACATATDTLELMRQGDTVEAREVLDELRERITESPLFDSQIAPKLNVLSDDVRTLRDSIVGSPNRRQQVEGNATFSNFLDTVCRQRPATNNNPFKFTEPTEAVSNLSAVATSTVLGRAVDLTFSAAPEFQSYSEEEQTISVAVSVAAPSRLRVRPPVSLVSVVDVSLSMSEPDGTEDGPTKLDRVKEANGRIIDELASFDSHYFGLVTFSNEATVVQPLTSLNTIRARPVKMRLEDVTAGANETNVYQGLLTGLQEHRNRLQALPPAQRSQTLGFVYLFTDVSNVADVTGETDIPSLLERFYAVNPDTRNVTVHTFGLGADLGTSLDFLDDIAEAGNGERRLVPDMDDVSSVATQALRDVLSVIADAVEVELEPMNNARVVSVRDGPQSLTTLQGEDGKTVQFRNLEIGGRRDILVDLRIPPGTREEMFLRVRGSYRDLVRFIDVNDVPPIDVRVARGKDPGTGDPKVIWVEQKTQSCSDVREALNQTRTGDRVGALATVEGAKENLTASSLYGDLAISSIKNGLGTVAGSLRDNDTGIVEGNATFDKFLKGACNQRGDPPFPAPLTPTSDTRGVQGEPSSTLITRLLPEFNTYSTEAQTIKVVFSAIAPPQQDGSAAVRITSVVDTSESMTGSFIPGSWLFKLDYVKEANRRVIDRFATEDGKHRFGLVTFASNSTVVQDTDLLLVEEARRLKETILGIAAGEEEETDLYGGLMTGLDQQQSVMEGKGIGAVLLFTDLVGEPTIGDVTAAAAISEELEEALEAFGDRHVSVHTFGLGTEEGSSLELLQEIAEAGNGQRRLITNMSNLPAVVDRTLDSLADVFAVNLNIEFRAVAGAAIIEMIEGTNSMVPESVSINNTATISFKDMVLGERRDVVLLLDIPEGTARIVLEGNATYSSAVTFDEVSTPVQFASVRRELADALPGRQGNPVPAWVVLKFDACLAAHEAAEQVKAGNRQDAITTLEAARPSDTSETSREINSQIGTVLRVLANVNVGPVEGNVTFANFFNALCNGRPPPDAVPAPPTVSLVGDVDFEGSIFQILAAIVGADSDAKSFAHMATPTVGFSLVFLITILGALL